MYLGVSRSTDECREKQDGFQSGCIEPKPYRPLFGGVEAITQVLYECRVLDV